MDRRQTPQKDLRTQYLILYNSLSGVLWTAVLGRVILLVPLVGFKNVYGGVGEWTKWTQTVAVLEILHSATGLVRSPLPTTIMQVFSRILLVWGIVDAYGPATTPSPFYSSMLVAWSATEVVRYGYFVLSLKGWVPGFVTWLRYNMFFVLYPMGIMSEVVMMWKAGEVARKEVQYALLAVIVAYIPGSYILYTHMIKQRRKIMRGKAPERRSRGITQ